MKYNACKSSIKLIFDKKDEIEVCNSPVKVNQAITNLVLNAINSYPKKMKKKQILEEL